MLKWNSVVFPHSMTWQPSIKSKEKKKDSVPKNSIRGITTKAIPGTALFFFLMAVSPSYLLTRPAKLLVHHNFRSHCVFLPSWKPCHPKAFVLFLCIVIFSCFSEIIWFRKNLSRKENALAVKVLNMWQKKGLSVTWITAIIVFRICSFGKLKLDLKYIRYRKKNPKKTRFIP